MTDLDPVIHAPLRLRIAAMLAVVDTAEFAKVRDALDVSDSVLSKHLSALVDAGYATNRKSLVAGRRTTWLALTPRGRAALDRHVAALRALLEPLGVPAAGGAAAAAEASEPAEASPNG